MTDFSLEVISAESSAGEWMYGFAEKLFPLCRSISGEGVRETLRSIQEHIPLTIHEVATGSEVFDWTIPKEWNIKDAYIKNSKGERVVDFKKSNLHVLNYSIAVHKKLSLKELKKYLITLPEQPDLIPYRTSYYKETWGFCLSHHQFEKLNDETYEVFIDSSLDEGYLSYGEYCLKGESEEEVLLSAHTCHPSLANDNLSGIALLTLLAKSLSKTDQKLTYRFIFAPGTIGSITWLARNEDKVKNIKHGIALSCVGDAGGPVYKRSRQGDAFIDKAIEHVLEHCGKTAAVVEDFSPYGYDERQYCSPGFNLAVGLFERSKHGKFPEYHTSADNLDFIKSEHLEDSYRMICQVINILEKDTHYINTNPKCEPQLGKRGLYSAMGGENDRVERQMAMLWVLNQADGSNSLLDIATRSKQPFALIQEVASLLEAHELLNKN